MMNIAKAPMLEIGPFRSARQLSPSDWIITAPSSSFIDTEPALPVRTKRHRSASEFMPSAWPGTSPCCWAVAAGASKAIPEKRVTMTAKAARILLYIIKPPWQARSIIALQTRTACKLSELFTRQGRIRLTKIDPLFVTKESSLLFFPAR